MAISDELITSLQGALSNLEAQGEITRSTAAKVLAQLARQEMVASGQVGRIQASDAGRIAMAQARAGIKASEVGQVRSHVATLTGRAAEQLQRLGARAHRDPQFLQTMSELQAAGQAKAVELFSGAAKTSFDNQVARVKGQMGRAYADANVIAPAPEILEAQASEAVAAGRSTVGTIKGHVRAEQRTARATTKRSGQQLADLTKMAEGLGGNLELAGQVQAAQEGGQLTEAAKLRQKATPTTMRGTLKGMGWKGKAGTGLAAAAGLAYLMNKLFGSKSDQAGGVDPMTQMMMLQQMQGAGGGGMPDTSRTLIDMNRLLQILETLKAGQGMTQGPPPVAQIA